MTKITLTDLANLQNENTAVTAINTNNAILETAFDNTLSRDGTSPNTMGASLDMNNKRIVNLPAPITSQEPLRAADLSGGSAVTVNNLPTGGTTGQTLLKNSGTNYDVSWSNPAIAVGSITGMGTGVSTFLATPTSANLRGALTDEVGTGSAYFVGGALGTPASGTATNITGLPISTGVSGLGTNVATFLGTPTSANLISTVTDETGSGSLVFGTSPTITTPNIVGTATNNNASAGSVGEYISSTRASGSALALTSGVASAMTSMSLTAGDWYVGGSVVFLAGSGCVTTEYHVCTDTASATIQSDESAHALHATIVTSQSGIIPVGMKRYSLSATTTVYLNTTQTFSGGTLSSYGKLWAVRFR